jgi:hypothetical protein
MEIGVSLKWLSAPHSPFSHLNDDGHQYKSGTSAKQDK